MEIQILDGLHRVHDRECKRISCSIDKVIGVKRQRETSKTLGKKEEKKKREEEEREKKIKR